MPVEARLAATQVPIADLLMAAEGDVVLLGTGPDQPVALFAADTRVATGRPGVRSGRMAIRVDRVEGLRG